MKNFTIPNFKKVEPKNDKGEAYDIYNELYSKNCFGDYRRFTTMKGDNVTDWSDGVVDHVTGYRLKPENKGDYRKPTDEELNRIIKQLK